MKQKLYISLLAVCLFGALLAEPKKALIFGVTGQDGTYLSEFLLEQGYEVHGVRRRSSTSSNTERIDYLSENMLYEGRFFLHYGDLSDSGSIHTLVQEINPDEVYNLAAQSHVGISFSLPEQTSDIDALGVLRILEAIRKTGNAKKTKFYQASTSELFGKVRTIPQTESTPFYPRSPYAVAKLYAYWITVNYREAYGMYACNGILFNHESPLRGENFVTRKITQAVAKIHAGLQETLSLGNLDAKRDWGYAKDYVIAMWSMLQQEKPADYVIATGQTHTVREFVELAFKEVGITICWNGQGVDEVGFDQATGRVLVKVDPQYYRPTEVDFLLGDATKAHLELNWKPATSFQDLVKIMMHEDVKRVIRKK